MFPVLRVSCFSQERYDGRLGLTGLQVLSSSLNLLVPQDLSQYSLLLHGPKMNGTRKYKSFHEWLFVYLCIDGQHHTPLLLWRLAHLHPVPAYIVLRSPPLPFSGSFVELAGCCRRSHMKTSRSNGKDLPFLFQTTLDL